MRILVACEFSGIVRDAFIRRGHDAVSCDLEPTERPGPHYQGDVMEVLYDWWDMVIAHPECRYLANSASKHLYIGAKKENGINPVRWANMIEATTFFNRLLGCGIPRIAVENPVIHCHAKKIVGQQTQTFQPWHHGHKEKKRTCLWLRGLEPLEPSNIVGPPPKDPEEKKKWEVVHRMPPGPNRSKDRSRTYPGIAEAMAEQWG